MRLYSFGNMYLLGIQAGIQCQHCTAELFNSYPWDEVMEADAAILYEWVENHKTTILLNGGMQAQLIEITNLLSEEENPYPWEFFTESEEALNGAVTNVSIILPEKIYMYGKWVKEYLKANPYSQMVNPSVLSREDTSYIYTKWELELIQLINSKRLMS